MAVVLNQNDPNNPNNQPQTGANGQPVQTIGTASPAGSAPAGSPGAASAANSLAQQQRTGSGRFTNLQKYLQANQGSGQKIADQIGGNINKDLQNKQQQAQNYYQQLGQNVQQANQTAQQGLGFQNQLKDIGSQIGQAQQAGFDQRSNQNLSGIEQFAQQPDFQRFQDIQAGRGIDESLLALQQQKALSQAQQAASAGQTAQQQLGNEGGRFELLRQAFGGSTRPGYSQGQQRLDQVLLGQGGGLGQVQADVASQLRASQEQAKLAAGQGSEVSRLTAQERGLMSDINSQAGSNEQAYMNMLGSYVDPLNAQRQEQFDSLGNSLGSYVPTYNAKTKKYSENAFDVNNQGLTSEQMANLGLTDSNQGVYNVFKDQSFLDASNSQNKNSALASLVASKGMDATTAQDVADESDVNRYAALSKIMGQNGPQRITQASQIGNAYTSKGDAETEGGLKGRLDRAQQSFDDNIANKNMSGSARYSYKQERDWMGNKKFKPADVVRSASGSVQDLLDKGRLGLNNQQAAGFAGLNQTARNNAVAQLQNTLDAQNYNRTLGGKRETFLDAENAAKIAASKAKLNVQEKLTQQVIPGENSFNITGRDPSLEYRQQHGDPNDPYNTFLGAGTKGIK